jgi:hypothetical protein
LPGFPVSFQGTWARALPALTHDTALLNEAAARNVHLAQTFDSNTLLKKRQAFYRSTIQAMAQQREAPEACDIRTSRSSLAGPAAECVPE